MRPRCLLRFEPSLNKKLSFPLRISSVDATKSAVCCGFWSHLLKRSLKENFIFCAMHKGAVIIGGWQLKEVGDNFKQRSSSKSYLYEISFKMFTSNKPFIFNHHETIK